MPDPTGGTRLTDLGCKVSYQKSHLVEPRSIKTPSDIRPGTKKGKLDRHPIWIVEIQMPKKVAFEMYKGYMDKMKNEIKLWLTSLLLKWAISICPEGNFKNYFAIFLRDNIINL
jgi:hypothetical protein